jgi:Flp pilus assembly protein TadB
MNQRRADAHQTEHQHGHQDDSMGMSMMLMMAACCLPFLVIAVLIPFLGVSAGLAVAVLGVGVAFILHRKFMRHGEYRR